MVFSRLQHEEARLAQLDNQRGGVLAPTVWVLTDGKVGDDVQCLAVASALTPAFKKKIVAPGAPWSWLAPWGPVDPRDNPTKPTSPINGAPPDVVIASGRRAIPYARSVKARSGGRTLVVILKDPRMGRAMADIIWTPAHDRLVGANIFSTLTSPHEVSAKIDRAKREPAKAFADLPHPLLGVVLGGPSGGARYGVTDASALAARLRLAAKDFASLAITPSRRTPDAFLRTLSRELSSSNLFVWDRKGENPYFNILASADALVVAADSHNMMSEAMATGTGIYAYRPPGLASKIEWFVTELEKSGAIRALSDGLEPFNTAPVDATPAIIDEIKKRLGLAPR